MGGRPSLPEDIKWQLGLEDKSYPRKELCKWMYVMVARNRKEGWRKEHYKAEERAMAHIQSYTDEGLEVWWLSEERSKKSDAKWVAGERVTGPRPGTRCCVDLVIDLGLCPKSPKTGKWQWCDLFLRPFLWILYGECIEKGMRRSRGTRQEVVAVIQWEKMGAWIGHGGGGAEKWVNSRDV